MSPKQPLSPITRYIRGLGEYLTLPEVARALRIPEETLRSWRKQDPESFDPSEMTYYGSMAIYLYTLEDFERVRTAAAQRDRLRGRPRLWTAAEAADRQRRGVLARQHELRARQLAGEGDPDRARTSARRAQDLRSELAEEGLLRRQRLGLSVT